MVIDHKPPRPCGSSVVGYGGRDTAERTAA